jgi:hypothetical protein
MIDGERLLLLLQGPEDYAHKAGQEMTTTLNSGKRLRLKAMSKIADRHFEIIMQTFSTEQTINIVKTWLSYYQLPFDPERLKTFDQFHQHHSKFISEHSNLIRSY